MNTNSEVVKAAQLYREVQVRLKTVETMQGYIHVELSHAKRAADALAQYKEKLKELCPYSKGDIKEILKRVDKKTFKLDE